MPPSPALGVLLLSPPAGLSDPLGVLEPDPPLKELPFLALLPFFTMRPDDLAFFILRMAALCNAPMPSSPGFSPRNSSNSSSSSPLSA